MLGADEPGGVSAWQLIEPGAVYLLDQQPRARRIGRGTLRGKPMARIAITPQWVGILDFQTRFPSALGI